MAITVLGASPSSNSINQAFAEYAAPFFSDDLDIHRLTTFEMPMFTVDLEAEQGPPPAVQAFIDMVAKNDVLIIGFAENNGFITTYYKNIIDWVSRTTKEIFTVKRVIAVSTSPSRTGADMAIEHGSNLVEGFGGEVIGKFSLPSFGHYFDAQTGITDPEHKEKFDAFVKNVKAKL